jgi:putative tryptophan/tyrosine transport system substrate-binding protein
MRDLAEDLLSRQPAVTVAIAGPGPVLALKAATSSVPIVFVSGLDPISYGFVASFNRPGGNVTGISFMTAELAGKRVGLLLQIAPTAKIVGYLSGSETIAVTKSASSRDRVGTFRNKCIVALVAVVAAVDMWATLFALSTCPQHTTTSTL